MKLVLKSVMSLFLFTLMLMSCNGFTSTHMASPTAAMDTAISGAFTELVKTQAALPAATPTPSPVPTATQTPTVFMVSPSPLPSTPPTPISPYEAEHRAIKSVIDSYFDQIYAMHNSFQVTGFDDVVSTSAEAEGFRKTALREQAVEIVWARLNFLRYASYTYTLDYSEIVVFDSGRQARANFTEGNGIVYELSIPSGIVSHMSGVKHIIMLRYEQDGWKIIYDVRDDYHSHRTLYDPTPFPQDVLDSLDKQLIGLSQAQGVPILPQAGNSSIPPDPVELERWKEYEMALAEKLLPQYPRDRVSCEWELMERSEQKRNIWAFCMTTVTSAEIGKYYYPAASVPGVIHLAANGAVQRVDIPEYGEQYLSDFRKLFPNGAWKELPNVSAMEKHLHWRRTHPTEPPLVVLNAEVTLPSTVSPTP